MSKEQNKSGIIIGILIGIIICLITSIILLATGIIIINNKTDDNKNNNLIAEDINNKNDLNNIENNNENSIDNNQQEEKDENNIKLTNNGVAEKDLNSVLDMLGLNKTTKNECLNYYLSSNKFRNNTKEIFGWYIVSHKLDSRHGYENIRDIDGDGIPDINACGGAANCGTIKKNDVNKIIKLYKLTNLDEHLDEMPEPYKDTDYLISYFGLTNKAPTMCNIETSHDVAVKYDNNNNIIIIDIQNVTEYKDYYDKTDENITKTKKQTVTYTFKQDTEGNYYLDYVEVK